jgi:hypothetical protein
MRVAALGPLQSVASMQRMAGPGVDKTFRRFDQGNRTAHRHGPLCRSFCLETWNPKSLASQSNVVDLWFMLTMRSYEVKKKRWSPSVYERAARDRHMQSL